MNAAKATLVKASTSSVHTVVSLGRLLAVHTYATWRDSNAAVTMRFEKATIETSLAELRRWEKLCHDALRKPSSDANLAGILTDLDNGEVW
ncbi:hypothetical protein ABQE69_09180 [Mycolicibacillus trivialis]